MTTGKAIAYTRWTFVGKVMSLLFNMLSRLIIAFLPRSKRFLISWLQSPCAMILEPPKIKSLTVSIVSPSICHEVMGPDAMILVFWMLTFKPTFSFSSFTFITRLFSSSLFAIKVVLSAYLRWLLFFLAVLIPASASSSLAFHMMYSAYKLNKQGNNIQPWFTPFPIWDQSVVPCPVLTVASWPAYRILRRQVRWSGIPISLRIFHSLLWSIQPPCCSYWHSICSCVMQTHSVNLPTQGQVQSQGSVSVGCSTSKNWVKCIDITLDCFITTLYYCAHPSTRCLKLALSPWLSWVWCILHLETEEWRHPLLHISRIKSVWICMKTTAW